ncbi:hypothetical protein [Enterovibrio norvegicus]|uniref:hypothetical protein n=1 Tax=Enterovibrio norvegicus TaxID=188144 RepID=UPI0002D48499|nr:hypothetical protein [Enterovibrio norvegicus]OEF57969.1 hypothetical protein A1OU_07110 [Enterovibrio norvegicus]
MTVAEDTISALQEAAAAYHGKIDDINDQLDAKKQEMDAAISALGARLVWAGGPAAHSLGEGRADLDMSSAHLEADTDYVEVSGAEMTINKAGLYMLHGFIMQHTNSGQRYLFVLINGDIYQNSQVGSITGWSTVYPSVICRLSEGDVIKLQAQVTGSNLYRAHSHSYHTKVHLLYLGDLT